MDGWHNSYLELFLTWPMRLVALQRGRLLSEELKNQTFTSSPTFDGTPMPLGAKKSWRRDARRGPRPFPWSRPVSFSSRLPQHSTDHRHRESGTHTAWAPGWLCTCTALGTGQGECSEYVLLLAGSLADEMWCDYRFRTGTSYTLYSDFTPCPVSKPTSPPWTSLCGPVGKITTP